MSTSRDVAGKSGGLIFTNQSGSAARSCAGNSPTSTCDGRRDAIRLPVVPGRIPDWFVDGRPARHLPALYEDRQCSQFRTTFGNGVRLFRAKQCKPAHVTSNHSATFDPTAGTASDKSFAITRNGTGRFVVSSWIWSTVDFHAYRAGQSGERSQVARTTDHFQRESLPAGIHAAEIGFACFGTQATCSRTGINTDSDTDTDTDTDACFAYDAGIDSRGSSVARWCCGKWVQNAGQASASGQFIFFVPSFAPKFAVGQ